MPDDASGLVDLLLGLHLAEAFCLLAFPVGLLGQVALHVKRAQNIFTVCNVLRHLPDAAEGCSAHPLHLELFPQAGCTMMNERRISSLNPSRVSPLTIRLPEQALAKLVLTLAFAAFGRGERHTPAAVYALAMDQPAITVTPPLSGDECEGVPQHTVAASPGVFRASYLVVLTWCFTFFSTVRVLAYMPTVMSIVQNGDSSQHSLWTWLTWLGANLTMAAWLFEQNGARMNKAVVVSAANAGMCLVTSAVIVAFRL